MKKAKILLTLLMLGLVMEAFPASEKIISFSKLPEKAQVFYKQYFSDKGIAAIKMENDYFFRKEYTILCKDGAKIKLASDGDWSKIEMKDEAVPAKIVPPAITKYVQKSFPNTYVNELEKTNHGYDVEISNGLDLEFDKKGTFLRVDD